MHPTARRLQERLHEQGLNVEIVELSDSTRTAQEAADAVGAELGQIVKSLVFVDGDQALLCLCAGGTPHAVFEVRTDALLAALPDAGVRDIS